MVLESRLPAEKVIPAGPRNLPRQDRYKRSGKSPLTLCRGDRKLSVNKGGTANVTRISSFFKEEMRVFYFFKPPPKNSPLSILRRKHNG